MIFIKESEIEKMRNHIVDSGTGMTELDRFEASHAFEDWVIVKG